MWSALSKIPDRAWVKALGMPGAEVAEVPYRPGGWKHEPLRLIVRRVPFAAEQIARLKGSRRLQTIHPEQLQMALDGQLSSVYGYSFILTDIPTITPPGSSISTAIARRSKNASRTPRPAKHCGTSPRAMSTPTASGSPPACSR